jgi:hypothetical protein
MEDEFFISLTVISTLRMPSGESQGTLRMPGRAGRFAAKIQGRDGDETFMPVGD